MKRLILSILFILCLSFQASAWVPTHVMSGNTSESSCPSYYASAIWSWNGDHDSGHNYGCTQAGVADVAETDNVVTGTDYGMGSGDIGMLIDTNANQYLAFTQTANQYVDPTSPQTICMRVALSGSMTTNVQTFWSGNSTDQVHMWVQTTTDVLVAEYDTTDGPDGEAVGTEVTADTTWQDIAMSWDQANDNISANPGDGVWASTWEEDTEITSAMTNTLTTFRIGSGATATGVGVTIYVTDFAIVSGYEQACPWQ